MRFTICWISLALLAGLAIIGEHGVSAQTIAAESNMNKMDSKHQPEAPKPNVKTESIHPFNLPTQTVGGTQLWTDFRECWGHRIQQNALTGHYRLLDPDNVRLAWGTKDSCVSELNRLAPRAPDGASKQPRHCVVMLHGLMRTRHCMKSLEQEFQKRDERRRSEEKTPPPTLHTIRYSYSSTRRSIGENAASLRELLEAQPPHERFSFVGHSMGNIVVRHLIGDLEADGDPEKLLPRMDAMVMLGPPNQGAAIARRMAPTKLYGWITGTGGLELGPEWEAFSKRLSTPKCPFLIIAGDVSDRTIQNPFVDGASDFVVSLEEAKLEGAEAIETVPLLHSFLMDDAGVTTRVVDYIESKWSQSTGFQ